ncbi:MAG: hypothetical protein NNA18_01225 [Nitrospira sp.]|nr:hypothetical protein [Nitrospira sp.]
MLPVVTPQAGCHEDCLRVASRSRLPRNGCMLKSAMYGQCLNATRRKEESVIHRILSLLQVCGMVIVTVWSIAGCAGKGEVRQLDLRLKPSVASATGVDQVKIVVAPFDDRRANAAAHLGRRQHLWGGETYFDVAGGRPAEVIAQRLVQRLQTKGWDGRSWNVRLEREGMPGDADIVITGEVEELSANARSRPFSTVIEIKQRLVITAKNRADNSSLTRIIEGGRTRTVFWFEEEDVLDLLNETINDGLDRFIADTKLDQGLLRSVR